MIMAAQAFDAVEGGLAVLLADDLAGLATEEADQLAASYRRTSRKSNLTPLIAPPGRNPREEDSLRGQASTSCRPSRAAGAL
jgi:hypothetical protein